MTSLQILEADRIFDLVKDKVVVLTGGASGIGEAAVRKFYALGAKVAFLDTNEAQGTAIVKSLDSSRVTFFKGSVVSWADQLNLFERTLQIYGDINIAVANAGVDETAESPSAFHDSFDADGKLKEPSYIVLDVTLRGVLNTTKIALHYFRKLQNHGSLVVTGSVASYFDTPGIPVYNAAKHGVLGLIRSLRDTLAKEGIRANVIAPWMTQTPLMAHILPIWGDLPINTTEEVARALVYLAINAEYHGKTIHISGGKYTELEDSITNSRPVWFGEENTAQIESRKRNGIVLGAVGST